MTTRAGLLPEVLDRPAVRERFFGLDFLGVHVDSRVLQERGVAADAEGVEVDELVEGQRGSCAGWWEEGAGLKVLVGHTEDFRRFAWKADLAGEAWRTEHHFEVAAVEGEGAGGAVEEDFLVALADVDEDGVAVGVPAAGY